MLLLLAGQVLKEDAASKSVRLARANGLRKLGRLFTDAAVHQMQSHPYEPVCASCSCLVAYLCSSLQAAWLEQLLAAFAA